MLWEKESELALRAVSTGGDLTFERPEKSSVSVKESLRDVVTSLDVRIEKHLANILGASGHPVFGEESWSGTPEEKFPRGTPYWLVDPVDGTANYVSGMPYYGVCAGLCVDETFVAGAVALPALKELFFTYGDSGAFVNGKPLKVADAPLSASLVAAGFSGVKGDPKVRARQYELFGRINDSSRGCLRLGSTAANICYAAAGRLQAAYGLQVQVWDVAAALAIAVRAGGKLHYVRTPNSTRCDYIVGAPAVVDEIRGLFDELGFSRAGGS